MMIQPGGNARPRAFAMLACGVAVAASACGGGAASTASRTPPLTVSTVAFVRNAGHSTSAKGSAKISVAEQVHADGKSVELSGTGAEDFKRHVFDLKFTVAGQQIETREVGQKLYEHLPPGAAASLSGGKPWLTIDLNTFAREMTGSSLSQLESTSQSNPAHLLSYLNTVASNGVHPVGTANVRGVPTTGYAVTVDLKKVAQQEPAALRPLISSLIKTLGTSKFPMTVWLDRSHLVRQLKFQLSESINSTPVSVSATMQIYDFGTAVTISAPPASQQTNITSKIAKSLAGTST